MFDVTFNHGLIRKYTTIMGTLLNNIYLNRQNSDQITIQSMKVPLIYGPKEKLIARTQLDPTLNKSIAINLPMISYRLTNMQYSAERKLNSLEKIYVEDPTNPDRASSQYMAVPYEFLYSVTVMAKNTEDLFRIIEQILPYFTPEFTVNATLIPSAGVVRDIQVVLNSTLYQEDYEGDFETRRYVACDLDFTLYGFFFGPVKNSKLIKQIELGFYEDTDASNTSIDVVMIPGLTANGTPTSNADISINKSLIGLDDDYGVIKTFTKDQ